MAHTLDCLHASPRCIDAWRALVPSPRLTLRLVGGQVAFMFLTRGPMPLEPLWKAYFKPEVAKLHNVYVHPSPDFDCAKGFKAGSPFHGRCLPRALLVRTAWGSPALVAAARNMLSFALADDPQNAYFALLSDSCIPLFPLKQTHAFLHDTAASWLVHMETKVGWQGASVLYHRPPPGPPRCNPRGWEWVVVARGQ